MNEFYFNEQMELSTHLNVRPEIYFQGYNLGFTKMEVFVFGLAFFGAINFIGLKVGFLGIPIMGFIYNTFIHLDNVPEKILFSLYSDFRTNNYLDLSKDKIIGINYVKNK
jgi:hypothetical protein